MHDASATPPPRDLRRGERSRRTAASVAGTRVSQGEDARARERPCGGARRELLEVHDGRPVLVERGGRQRLGKEVICLRTNLSGGAPINISDVDYKEVH